MPKASWMRRQLVRNTYKFARRAIGRSPARLKHYSLDRPSSPSATGCAVDRGTQFRQWATARLSEYLVKGFTLDDERLKNPPGQGQTDYFDELLERIRDIRSSERRFYQKVLDIYATSMDYDAQHGDVAAVLRDGAEQDALGRARAYGGGGRSTSAPMRPSR